MGDKPDFYTQMLLFVPLMKLQSCLKQIKRALLICSLINAKVNITQAILI